MQIKFELLHKIKEISDLEHQEHHNDIKSKSRIEKSVVLIRQKIIKNREQDADVKKKTSAEINILNQKQRQIENERRTNQMVTLSETKK